MRLDGEEIKVRKHTWQDEEREMQTKTCPMCGTDADSREDRCLNCDYRFNSDQPTVATTSLPSEAGAPAAKHRPDGGIPMSIGWLCFVISIILLAISFSIKLEPWEVGPYAGTSGIGRAAEKLRAIVLLQVGAGGLFSLFLVMWSVGYIARAISFLPSKQD